MKLKKLIFTPSTQMGLVTFFLLQYKEGDLFESSSLLKCIYSSLLTSKLTKEKSLL